VYLASLLVFAAWMVVILAVVVARYVSGRLSHLMSFRSWTFWVFAAVGALGASGVEAASNRAIKRLYGRVPLRSRRTFLMTPQGRRVKRILRPQNAMRLALRELRGRPGRED
jgi:hypothetical protein